MISYNPIPNEVVGKWRRRLLETEVVGVRLK
jgi:hypothetical protein